MGMKKRMCSLLLCLALTAAFLPFGTVPAAADADHDGKITDRP